MAEKLWDVPPSWVWTNIASVGDVVAGGTPSTNEPSYWGNEINWISPADLTGYTAKTISRGAKGLSRKGLMNSSAKVMPAGSVHFSSRAPIGYVVISTEPLATNQGFKSLVPATGVFNEFVYYYLMSIKKLAESRARGTTFRELSGAAFGSLPFPLAPESEQRRIVKKIEELFSELNKGIESLKAAREQLKTYRQTVLEHAFEGKLTAKWREDHKLELETSAELLSRINRDIANSLSIRPNARTASAVASTKAKTDTTLAARTPPVLTVTSQPGTALPDGWLCVKAEHVMHFITKGTTPPKQHLASKVGDVPFLKVYNLTKTGALDFSIEPTFVSCETHNRLLARSKVFPGDVLMNIVGPPLGKVSIVPNTYPEWNVNQAIAIFRSDIVSSRFLAAYLLSESTVRVLTEKSKATAGQFNLTLKMCRDMWIPVCCKREQEQVEYEIEAKLSLADYVEKSLSSALRHSEALRQSILLNAFSGRLVSQDADDESATALLERIGIEKSHAAKLGTDHKLEEAA
jgi:type I restriction enzyme S subunit